MTCMQHSEPDLQTQLLKLFPKQRAAGHRPALSAHVSPTDLNKILEIGKQLCKEMSQTTVSNGNNKHLHSSWTVLFILTAVVFYMLKIYSLSLSFHTAEVYHAFSRAQHYFHSSLWEAISPLGWPQGWVCTSGWPCWEGLHRAGQELFNKPCQSKPAITSAHKFLPSRDFRVSNTSTYLPAYWAPSNSCFGRVVQ